MAGAGKGKGRVVLDLNSPEFQDVFFNLEREQIVQVVAALRRLAGMDWNEVYRSKGLKWEKLSYRAPNGSPVYSFRFSQKVRGVGYRDGDYLRIVSLHPDHDSAYEP